MDIKPGQKEVQQALVTPVIATALMVQYSALWENLSEAAAEVLHCPRCSHTVVDVHGVCRYCRENAYQVTSQPGPDSCLPTACAPVAGSRPACRQQINVIGAHSNLDIHLRRCSMLLFIVPKSRTKQSFSAC